MPERDEVVEEAIDRASERARNGPPRRMPTAEAVAAREAALKRRAYREGRAMQAPNMVLGGTNDGS